MKKRNSKSETPAAASFTDSESQALASKPLLFGEVVADFSARRLMAVQSLGFKFFKLSEAERAQLADSNNLYDGMFWDAVLVAYICQAPMSMVFKSFRLPEIVMDAAATWAEQKQVTPGKAGFDEVMTFFGHTIEGIIASSAEEGIEGDKPDPSKASPARKADHLPGE